MPESTTIQGLLVDVNTALDLPHGDMPAVEAHLFAHGWRIKGAGFTTSGMDENQAQAFLTGMATALAVAAARDN